MNTVILKGRLVKDVEISFTKDQKAIGKFTIALNDRLKKDKVHFFDCVSFGKLAENISKFFKKGSEILIAGSMSQNVWTSKDGQKKSKIEIIVNTFDFCGKKTTSENPVLQAFPNADIISEDSEEVLF